jgi:hypothetical protein
VEAGFEVADNKPRLEIQSKSNLKAGCCAMVTFEDGGKKALLIQLDPLFGRWSVEYGFGNIAERK